MKSYKKIFFKYTLIVLFLIFFINTIFTVGQQSVRKIIESDRLFLFLMKNTMLNLNKLSEYQPTDEDKLKFNEIIKKIAENWKIDNES
jgi:hypothetical protein|tara:strand:- start:255 stop:518 length:264 start_codon:yes stop_codon:yes gene_type:complete